ncbi:hypothetical protein I4U23_021141 [Adineta vaga]|nr:hypothetical protein I4U23_021141 [Adineta vaga]
MVLLVICSIFHCNKVESRALHQNSEDFLPSLIQRIQSGRNMKEIHHDLDDNEYVHGKRKSDFLLSLYGLPYTLVNKRAFE